MIKYLYILLLLVSFSYSKDTLSLDNDNDLIPNSQDKCPNTPQGVFVDNNGCIKDIKKTIEFAPSSAKLEQKYNYILKEVIELANGAKGYNIRIEGNTDSISDDSINLTLSKERAMSVYNKLLESGISKKRITLKWYGEINPISTNITKLGRAKNRRVDIIFFK